MNYIKTLLNAISLRLNEIISRLNKVDEKTLPEPTADGNALIAVNGEWTQQDGYGYVKNNVHLTWDGDTDGKYSVRYTPGAYWYLIDDNVHPFNDVSLKYVFNGVEHEIIHDSLIPDYEQGTGALVITENTYNVPVCIVCPNDNITLGGFFNFEHKGIYLLKADMSGMNMCVNEIDLNEVSPISPTYIDSSTFIKTNSVAPQFVSQTIDLVSSQNEHESYHNKVSIDLNDRNHISGAVFTHSDTLTDESYVSISAEPNRASIELCAVEQNGISWPMMSMFVSTEQDEPVQQISGLTTPTQNSHAANKKYVDDSIDEKIGGISELIPSAATSQNQLADKAFVNSTVGTNTAVFRGTFNSLQELEAYSGDKTNNDYAFVISEDSDGNTVYNRYKYNGTSFVYEYSLNNSSFTSDQWAAIQSGITSNDVALIESAIQPSDLDSYRTASEQDTIDNTKQPKTVSSEYYDATTVEGALDEIAQKAGELPSDTDDADEVSIDSTITAQSTGIPTSAAVIAYISSLGTVEGGNY